MSSPLEIIKRLYKNKSCADISDDGVKYLLLVKDTTEILLSGLLAPTPHSNPPPKKDIKPSCLSCMAAKTFGGNSPATEIFRLLIFHSVCSWHLERRSNNYHKTHMAGEGHLLCMDWWMGLFQKASISRRNNNPISVWFSSEVTRISLAIPKHHKNPMVGRSHAHHWTGPR